MSRRNREEIPFGSDSFLDVLANIVGILIILIVAAAARMGRAPDPVLLSQKAPDAADISPAVPPRAPPEPDSEEPPAELTAEMTSLAARLAALDTKSQAVDARLKQVQSDIESAKQLVGDDAQKAAGGTTKLRDAQLRVARLEEALGERKQVLTGLLAEFEEAQNARVPSVEVRHRLAPISQEITGEELHFRVSGGRVTVVPMNLLVERIRGQLERQKDWLANRGKHEAVVGPVDGYTMRFLVEKRALSALDRSRLGYGGYRIAVTHYELVPEPDLVGETAEEALRRQSKFAQAVKMAPIGAALTFWVYPDSFHAYRILQAACQAEGFIVAGRPLPDGIPIRGSPDGSHSAGQ
jgi:hypothetical protein